MSESLWKFFIVEITYRVPAEQLGDIVGQHRAYLQEGFERNWLLMSGPQNPRTGGIVVARAPSLAAIQEFFARDPYQVNGLADYRFIEFEPLKRQDVVLGWITEA